VDQEAEYVDEGRYTTVTIEAMDVSKEGLHKVEGDRLTQVTGDKRSPGGDERVTEERRDLDEKPRWTREKSKDRLDGLKKKRKFRYESKGERKVARAKEKMRKGRQASARRAG
jgi:ribosomal RNA-processing protein 17